MQSEVAQLPLPLRVWGWFERNRQQALWGLAAAVLVIFLVTFLLYRHSQKDVVAGRALSVVTAPQPGPTPRPESPQALVGVANEYPKTPAGARARLMAGVAFFTEGKYDEARTQFERFLRESRDNRFAGQALLGIAACHDAQGKTNEAVLAYKSLIDGHPGDSVLPQAKFSLGCLYEGQGKLELARGLFEEVGNDRFGSLGSEAGMRHQELLRRHPELIPPPKAITLPTNTPASIATPPIQIQKP